MLISFSWEGLKKCFKRKCATFNGFLQNMIKPLVVYVQDSACIFDWLTRLCISKPYQINRITFNIDFIGRQVLNETKTSVCCIYPITQKQKLWQLLLCDEIPICFRLCSQQNFKRTICLDFLWPSKWDVTL